MCFSPKIKMPKTNTTAIPEPAPLTEEVKGVEFGSTKEDEGTVNTSESQSTSGRGSLKVVLNKSPAKRTSVKSRIGTKK